ncbi:MAG TPA: cysteine desulfurase family protein [Acidimicrobiales bacterium]|nr:cysteine desulfurase family protein [Acidimicrobiales bacterium]
MTTTYLDHAATTPLRPEVAEAMAEARREPLGNPTGSHRPAQRARRLLEEARDEVAAQLGRRPGEIIFTSGGTEAANLAVFGTLEAQLAAGAGEAPLNVLCSAVEHPAVRESCRAAARYLPVNVRPIAVDAAGVVDPDAVAEAVDGQTALVAVMLANNETGVLQPLAAVAAAVRARSETARVFTDAVQATSFVDLAECAAGADLLALSAHKVGGPVGVGVLAVRPPATVLPHQHGGGQERERRSGTQDVVGALGLATALRLAAAERAETVRRVIARRDRLAAGLLEAIDGAHRTIAPGVATLPGHLHLCLAGVEREELLVALGALGICASGGSSCASGALDPSYVLAAMGVPEALARGAIRFTLGHDTTEADIDRALAVIPGVVASLRHDP